MQRFTTLIVTLLFVYKVVANQAPVLIHPPGRQTILENIPTYFTHPIYIVDDARDADQLSLQLTLANSGAALWVWDDTARLITAGTNGGSSLLLVGTITQLNKAISNLRYLSTPHQAIADSLTVTINDNGWCCGAPQSATLTIPITVVAQNNAPVVGCPQGPITVQQNATIPLTFNINDFDGAYIRNLSAIITVDPPLAVQFTFPFDPWAVGIVVRKLLPVDRVDYKWLENASSITLTQVLTGFKFTAGLPGITSLSLSVDDMWSVSNCSVTVIVTPLNHQPTLLLPVNLTTGEDIAVRLCPSPGSCMVEDYESDGGEQLTLFITSQNGIITAPTPISGSLSNGIHHYVMQGSKDTLNGVLATLSYQPNQDWSGTEYLWFNLTDGVNTGAPGRLSFTRILQIDVLPLNDPPVISILHQMVQLDRESTATIVGVTITDVDAGTNPLRLLINSSHGVLSIGYDPQLSISQGNLVLADQTIVSSTVIEVSGPQNALNFAIDKLTYKTAIPRRNEIGHINDPVDSSDVLVISVADNGSSGMGSPGITTAYIGVTVTAASWPTCASFLQAYPTTYCGCFYQTTAATAQVPWTKLPVDFPSSVFLGSADYPRRFMQGCCAEMLPSAREYKLQVRQHLGLCTPDMV